MPLTPGTSRSTIAKNIREMEAAGHPHDQAVAASLREAYGKPKPKRVKARVRKKDNEQHEPKGREEKE